MDKSGVSGATGTFVSDWFARAACLSVYEEAARATLSITTAARAAP